MAGIGWSEIDAEERRRVEECFPVSISLINDLIRYDNGFVMPRSYPEKLEKGIYDFELPSVILAPVAVEQVFSHDQLPSAEGQLNQSTPSSPPRKRMKRYTE